MKIYIITINGNIEPKAFTSLKSICIEHGLNYNTASKGKRIFIKKIIHVFHIQTLELVKIKGRENNRKHKLN